MRRRGGLRPETPCACSTTAARLSQWPRSRIMSAKGWSPARREDGRATPRAAPRLTPLLTNDTQTWAPGLSITITASRLKKSLSGIGRKDHETPLVGDRLHSGAPAHLRTNWTGAGRANWTESRCANRKGDVCAHRVLATPRRANRRLRSRVHPTPPVAQAGRGHLGLVWLEHLGR